MKKKEPYIINFENPNGKQDTVWVAPGTLFTVRKENDPLPDLPNGPVHCQKCGCETFVTDHSRYEVSTVESKEPIKIDGIQSVKVTQNYLKCKQCGEGLSFPVAQTETVIVTFNLNPIIKGETKCPECDGTGTIPFSDWFKYCPVCRK